MNAYDFDGTIYPSDRSIDFGAWRASDSFANTPPALCTDKAYFVSGSARVVRDWHELDDETSQKVRERLDTGWTVHIKR